MANINQTGDDTNTNTNSGSNENSSSVQSVSKSKYIRKNRRRKVDKDYEYENPFKRQITTNDVVRPGQVKDGKLMLMGPHCDENNDIKVYMLLHGKTKDGTKLNPKKYLCVKEYEVTSRMFFFYPRL